MCPDIFALLFPRLNERYYTILDSKNQRAWLYHQEHRARGRSVATEPHP